VELCSSGARQIPGAGKHLLPGPRQGCTGCASSENLPSCVPAKQQRLEALRQVCSGRGVSKTSAVATWSPCEHCGGMLERAIVNSAPAVGALEPKSRRRHVCRSGCWVVSSLAGGVRAEARALVKADSEGPLLLPCRSTRASRARQVIKRRQRAGDGMHVS
jgi:hypothetical protein